MQERILTCIGCPMGCEIKVSFDEKDGLISSDSIRITGNTCKRGEQYGVSEVTNPTRTFTGTVSALGATGKVVPVKTKEPIPKNKMLEVAEAVNQLKVSLPAHIGEVVAENICETGVELVVTGDID